MKGIESVADHAATHVDSSTNDFEIVADFPAWINLHRRADSHHKVICDDTALIDRDMLIAPDNERDAIDRRDEGFGLWHRHVVELQPKRIGPNLVAVIGTKREGCAIGEHTYKRVTRGQIELKEVSDTVQSLDRHTVQDKFCTTQREFRVRIHIQTIR